MLGRAANFQSEDGSVMNLCYTSDSRSGLSLGSAQESKASREVAHRSPHRGEGKGAVAFLSISCSVVERSTSWVAMAGGVRLSLENSITTAIFSSPEK